MYEELGLDPGEDMAEASHLNHRGSAKLSAWLADWLRDKYSLPDRRGEASYESWEQNALRWEQLCANQTLREETGWYDFIKLLIQNPNYTYLISLNGDYDSVAVELGTNVVTTHIGVVPTDPRHPRYAKIGRAHV